MPKIFATTLSDHHDQVWSSLVRAVETCLARKPYDQISLAEIAADAGIARNTIYNYARDKGALVVAVTGFAAAPLVAEVTAIEQGGASAVERLSAMIRTILGWVRAGEYRALIRHAIYTNGPDPREAMPLLHDLARQFSRIASDGAREGVFRHDNEVTLLLVPGIMQAAAASIFHRPDDHLRIEDEVIRIMLAAFKANP